jgi:predicted N-acetyltransferase YhbS
VRAERPGDVAAIADLVIRAYADIPYSDHREHLMIERLRDSDAFIPALSLLAERDGAAVGHILLTRAQIGSGSHAATTLALAPLSVVPDCQRMGVGKRLVTAAHRRAADLGFETILLVGIPSYYLQFGYQPLSRYPITLPFEAPDADCMILPLKPGALEGVSGIVRYADAWLDH